MGRQEYSSKESKWWVFIARAVRLKHVSRLWSRNPTRCRIKRPQRSSSWSCVTFEGCSTICTVWPTRNRRCTTSILERKSWRQFLFIWLWCHHLFDHCTIIWIKLSWTLNYHVILPYIDIFNTYNSNLAHLAQIFSYRRLETFRNWFPTIIYI